MWYNIIALRCCTECERFMYISIEIIYQGAKGNGECWRGTELTTIVISYLKDRDKK